MHARTHTLAFSKILVLLFFQLEPGQSKDIYMPIVPARTLVQGVLTFHVSATCFMERDDYTGNMTVIVSCRFRIML